METTIGQLNFFRWAFDNYIIEYIEEHYSEIEQDMNQRNNSRKKQSSDTSSNTKTRKRREELSVSACKCIKKEDVHIVVKFS